ncbi:trypsin-like peptidase domain-containing protein [Leifsonia aquatica]|uniref:trypsin-like peptidase domain-containing protein n=1 Tax=Leifsonia aquatica TaxID=144185 RepID=UPI00046A2698|nr:trypsin-like peptidase domain-containing protein [Leifsonia aquatica]
MTDTPITPEPAKAQHDADTDAVVDAGTTASTDTPTTDGVAAAAPAAPEPAPAAPAAPVAPAVPAAETPAAPAAPVVETPAPLVVEQPAAPAAVAPAGPVAPSGPVAPAGWTAPAAQPGTPAAHHQTQPTQPLAPQQPYGAQPTAQQPDYGNGSFGQPAYAGAAPGPYAPHTHQHAYAAAPGTPAPGAERPAKKRSTGLIIATLAIGALVGGLAGAGAGVGIYSATTSNNATIKTVSGPQNITVNDANNATTVTAVAAKASPSVVTISVTASSEGGTGSGIVLTSDGYILTNTHVVTLDGAASDVSISVTDNNGKIYSAKIVGTDPTTDLAVIKLDGASGMTPMTFADSSKLNVGDTAVAIGAPLGLSGTVTDGIVSALNRSISIASSAAPKSSDGSSDGNGSSQNPFNFDFPGQGGSGSQQQQQSSSQGTISLPVIQTDASINPGNSGGALLNSKGELIGVNVAIASASGSSSDSSGQSGSIGVGFAIPANLAKRVSDELIKNGSATHGLLGASVADASSDSKATTVGALIKDVTSGGAASSAGLKAGDVVVNFNGVPITDATDLTAQVRALAAGASADLTYIRDGQTKTTSVTLGSLTTN